MLAISTGLTLMPPIGRRTALKLIAGSVAGSMAWSAAPWVRAATAAPAPDGRAGDAVLSIGFDKRMHTRVWRRGKPLTGWQPSEALLLAAKVRLRPILMTTLAMIFGMVPLAFALTEGAEQRAPMGQAVIGGVITSSLLTLVVVPVVQPTFNLVNEFEAVSERGEGGYGSTGRG